MTGLHHFWNDIWPNLASDVVWLPLVAVYHRLVQRRLDALHLTIQGLHVKLNQQLTSGD